VNVNLRDSLNGLSKGRNDYQQRRSGGTGEATDFNPYSLDDTAWTDYLHARDARKQSVVPVPQFVKVEGTDAILRSTWKNFLLRSEANRLKTPKLDKLLTRLTAFGKFDWVGYRIAERDGRAAW